MFSRGEIAVCVDNKDCGSIKLTVGREYRVEQAGVCGITIIDDDGSVCFSSGTRFSKKPELPTGFTQNIDPNRGCFWMVKGDGPKSFEHYSEEMANKEAERLAKEHAGQTFFVLGPLRSFRKSDVQVTEFKHCLDSGESDAVPF